MKAGERILIKNIDDFSKIPKELTDSFNMILYKKESLKIVDVAVCIIDYPFIVTKAGYDEYYLTVNNSVVVLDIHSKGVLRMVSFLRN